MAKHKKKGIKNKLQEGKVLELSRNFSPLGALFQVNVFLEHK